MEYNDLVGIPFRMGGHDITGMDCWGLVVEFYKRMGFYIETPLDGGWERATPPFRFGDVLAFGFVGSLSVTHCGIWIGGNKILHAMDRLGVIISPLRHMNKRFHGAYRYAATCCNT